MTSPNNQLIINKIKSGELFTDEYQDACRQRKAAVMLERQKQRKVMDELLELEVERMRAYAKGQSTDVYAGKKSGDYVGD